MESKSSAAEELIENENLGIGEKRAGDGDPLFDAQRQIAHGRSEIDVEAQELAHQGACFRDFLLRADVGAEQIVGADIKIVEHRAFIGNQHFLIDIGDAKRFRLDRRTRGFSEDRYLPAVGNEHARNDFGERTLARPVAADDRVNFPIVSAQACAIERHGGAEVLADRRNFHGRNCHGSGSGKPKASAAPE